VFREIEPKACGWRKRREGRKREREEEEERGGGEGGSGCVECRPSFVCVALCEERENNKREREMRARVCE
jgi:hypothetical protein